MTVAIIDHGSGNLRSAAKAFERQASEPILVTSDPDEVAGADRVVLPGVGAFGDCRRGIERLDGMIDALTEAVIAKGRPFLGICVGMQLMADVGLEHGRHPGLGWIAGEVRAVTPSDPALKVPHMGWNALPSARRIRCWRALATAPTSISCTATSWSRACPARSWRRRTMAARLPPWSDATTWSARSSTRRRARRRVCA